MGCGIRFIVTKTEAYLFKNDPPNNEKGKVSFCAVSLMTALLLLASTCSVFVEHWSPTKSVYECIRVYNFHNHWLWRLHSPRLICKEGRSWRDSRLSGDVVQPYFLFPVYHGS